MAYQFVNNQKASATVTESGSTDTYKIAGVNGKQTDANKFQTAIHDFLHIVGKANDAQEGLARSITQSVETIS